MTGYCVQVADRAGVREEYAALTFADLLTIVRELRARVSRDDALAYFNLDRVDLEFDGLTDEEREALQQT